MKKANIGVRAGVYLIDRVIVCLPLMLIYIYMCNILYGDMTGAGEALMVFTLFPNTLAIYYILIYGLSINSIIEYIYNITPIILILCFLFILMELIYKGRTNGQKRFHLEVVTKDGGQPTFARRVARNFAKAIGMALYPISLVYYIIKRETPWDTVTKTMVIDKEK